MYGEPYPNTPVIKIPPWSKPPPPRPAPPRPAGNNDGVIAKNNPKQLTKAPQPKVTVLRDYAASSSSKKLAARKRKIIVEDVNQV